MKMEEQRPQSEFKRQTAFKCSIDSLSKGVFVKRPGWESSFLMTEYGDFSRVNVIAVVVSKENNTIILDDGTGHIDARFFDNTHALDEVSVGNLVLVIGRPREFNSRIYLTLEIVKKIHNMLWIGYRRKELTLIRKIRSNETLKSNATAKKEPLIVESSTTINSRDKIIRVISDLDSGEGAGIEDVIRISGIKNPEEILQDLIMRGDIFEFKSGRVKLM